jgi:hypothetical protein
MSLLQVSTSPPELILIDPPVATPPPPAVATIQGKVYSPDGKLLQGAIVEALRVVFTSSSRDLYREERVITNDLGEYRLFLLPAGQYYLSATAPGGTDIYDFNLPRMGIGSNTGGTHFRQVPDAALQRRLPHLPMAIPVYFPGGTDLAQASLIDLPQDGHLTGMNLRTARTTLRTIQGLVFSRNFPVDGSVMVVPQNQTHRGEVVTTRIDPAGRFRIDQLLPGRYSLLVTSSATQLLTTVPLEVRDTDLPAIRVNVEPNVDVVGRVMGTNSANITLMSHPDLAWRNMPSVQRRVPFARSGTDGSFVMRDVVRGTYRVNIVPATGYVRGIRRGSEDLSQGVLRLEGGSTGDLEITIGTDGATLNGNADAAGIAVVLVPAAALRQRADRFYTATTNTNGQFSIPSIAPGIYKIFAKEGVAAAAWQDPAMLSLFEKQVETIQLLPNQRLTRPVKVLQ